ncbi:MAG: mechanosensitive ion channel [Acutalibacter sp.]|nr:mechanosensitive ion channel [Acutalibacter sp.]
MNTTWDKLWESFRLWLGGFVGNIVLAIGIFLIGWLLARLASKVTKKAISRGRLDPLVVSFIGSLVKALVILIAFISAIAQLGINITSLIAALGAAGLTASFALQGSLSNLVSGIQIIFTKPFRTGDYLSFGEYEGTVKRIEILYTVLSTLDNKEVIVPNSQITGGVVVNFSRNGTRRLDLSYGISYTADVEKAKAVLQEVVSKEPLVLKEPAPLIVVGEWKESSITLAAKVWCHHKDYWNLYFTMQEAVKLAFDREGITIPFPQLDVHLDK